MHFGKLVIMESIYLIRVFCQRANMAIRFLYILLASYGLISNGFYLFIYFAPQ